MIPGTYQYATAAPVAPAATSAPPVASTPSLPGAQAGVGWLQQALGGQQGTLPAWLQALKGKRRKAVMNVGGGFYAAPYGVAPTQPHTGTGWGRSSVAPPTLAAPTEGATGGQGMDWLTSMLRDARAGGNV